MNRFEIERAVEASDLPKGARHVVFALARRFNNDAGRILPRHMPSITDLQRATAMSRSGVCFSLDIAEKRGWFTRIRPDLASQRRDHARTAYELRIPGQPAGPGLVQSSRPHSPATDMFDRAAARAARRDAEGSAAR